MKKQKVINKTIKEAKANYLSQKLNYFNEVSQYLK